MFLVRADYLIESPDAAASLDEALVSAVGLVPSKRAIGKAPPDIHDGDYRTLWWVAGSFDQAAAIKSVLDRMAGVNATFREQ